MTENERSFDVGGLMEGQKWLKSTLEEMKTAQNDRHQENKARFANLEEHYKQIEHDGKGTRTAVELLAGKVRKVEGEVEQMKLPVALFNSYNRRTKWALAACASVLLSMMLLVHYINDVWELGGRLLQWERK